jgi:hypothetical protein
METIKDHRYIVAFELLAGPKHEYGDLRLMLQVLHAKSLTPDCFVFMSQMTVIELLGKLGGGLTGPDRIVIARIDRGLGSFDVVNPIAHTGELGAFYGGEEEN